MELTDLAQLLLENSEDLDRTDSERMMVMLYHADIPYLEDAGLVEFDVDEKEVTLTEDARE